MIRLPLVWLLGGLAFVLFVTGRAFVVTGLRLGAWAKDVEILGAKIARPVRAGWMGGGE